MPDEAFMPHPVVPETVRGQPPHTSIIPPFPCATLRAIPYCLEFAMRRELAIEFSRVTESAALAGYKWLGRGDKNTADGAAVNAMRIMLNQVNIDGTIVIGEGEIDEAPMLYIGEKVGTGRGDAVDIAVDPIEGHAHDGDGPG